MSDTRREFLTTAAGCAGGVAGFGGGQALAKPEEKPKETVLNDTKKEVMIENRLTYPKEHLQSSFSERLPLIQAFMTEEGLKEEFYCSGEAIDRLEGKIADIFGKEAAMWSPTGTMAQGIAIRIHGAKTNRNYVQLHPTSHLVLHEQDGYKHAHGFDAIISGEWREPMTADLLDDRAACMIIEMGQRHSGGLVPSWEQLQNLKQTARKLGVPLHMDGARIWSCRSYYEERTFAEIADGFSSIYVSFYKDIGAFGGAALVGDKDFIEEAKVWRARLGGLVSEHWPVVCDTLRLIDRKLDNIDNQVDMAREYATFIQERCGQQVFPNPPQTNMFHVMLPFSSKVATQAHAEFAKKTGFWLTNRFWHYESDTSCAMEFKVGETLAAVPKGTLQNALRDFFALI